MTRARGGGFSQDPLGFDAGDSNLYRYVNNQPTDKTDPSGMAGNPQLPDWVNTGLANIGNLWKGYLGGGLAIGGLSHLQKTRRRHSFYNKRTLTRLFASNLECPHFQIPILSRWTVSEGIHLGAWRSYVPFWGLFGRTAGRAAGTGFFRMVYTARLGPMLGRTLPYVGWGLLGYEIFDKRWAPRFGH